MKGARTRASGVEHDATELVEARSAIERLTQHLLKQQAFDRAVLDGVELGILTTDEAGRVTYCNRAARGFLVVDTDEFDVHRALSLDAPLDRQVGRPHARTLVAADGHPREIDVTVTRPDAARAGFAFLLVLRDATRESELQDEMRRVERLAAMGTMVAGFAHEVRNPVASLRTMAESLGEDLSDAGLDLPHIRRMLNVLARIERLVNTLLQYGKPASPRPAPHRPWSIISVALSTLAGRARELGGEIRVEIEPDLPDVHVDEGQLVQVLVILLNNALDATGASRRVLVRAVSGVDSEPRSRPTPASTAQTVVFEVVDDGAGVPRDVEARMYDPFFTTKPSGTGLGLSIAQQIVSENGGRLALTSAADPTTFAVSVPAKGD